jgi:hypothetical protein
MIHIIECSTLNILNLRWHNSLSVQKKTGVCEFLSKQMALESFSVSSSNDFFYYLKSFKLDFKLKSFTFSSNNNFRDHESFVGFLDLHKNSLKSLKIRMYSFDQTKNVIKEIVNYVKKFLINLTELEIDTVFKGNSKKFQIIPDYIKSFDKIERFGFSDIFHCLSDNKQLVDMLPKMKHLSIKSCFCKAIGLLEYLATKKTLESLKIFHFDNLDTTVTFPNLREFSVHTFSSNEHGLSSFIARHTETLEKIIIGNADNITQSTVNSIIECRNLKYLLIDVSDYKLSSIMAIFHEIFLRNKPLTVVFKDYPSRLTFELPKDKLFWKEHMNSDSRL